MAKAAGATNKAIAEEFGYSEARISIIFQKKEVAEKVKQLQEEYWGHNTDKRFQNLANQAISVYEDVINEKGASHRDKISAANALLDRALGKAQQSISVEGNVLGDLIARLDAQDARNKEQPSLDSNQEKDEVDTFMEDFVGEGLVVGKRTKDGD